MKTIIILIISTFMAVSAQAQDMTIYQTIPGTNIRDYTKSGIRVDGNHVYQTIPGTDIRDLTKPGAIMDGNDIYPTLPGTRIRDLSQPGITIENNRIFNSTIHKRRN